MKTIKLFILKYINFYSFLKYIYLIIKNIHLYSNIISS